jgi:hypothetical protein
MFYDSQMSKSLAKAAPGLWRSVVGKYRSQKSDTRGRRVRAAKLSLLDCPPVKSPPGLRFSRQFHLIFGNRPEPITWVLKLSARKRPSTPAFLNAFDAQHLGHRVEKNSPYEISDNAR